MESPHLS